MRFDIKHRSSDGSARHGVRLAGTDPNSPASGPTRRRTGDGADDDDSLIETPGTFEDYDEFSGDNDATPDDRRRDPLRKNW
ncbi:MAG: hypothetical protein NVSMB68_08840 [Thermoanaerobaculia bacterium]